jgi:Zn-dependent protease with chaperone function
MQVACPHCSAPTVLTADLPADASQIEEITAAELQDALSKAVAPRPISIFYQLGLILVTLFMVLLPAVYLAFIAVVAYGTYWYAIHVRGLLDSFTGGGQIYILKLMIYAAPLLAGGTAAFFMFKPILAPKPKQAKPIELNPAQHPRLYQIIAHISDVLKVPMPREVYLSCELNASAGLRRGFLSFFGNDLAMTIGMPLAAGLTAQQLTAVIAHELGHCTQGLAMRLCYVIHSINHWFFRVVYQRDAWDVGIAEWQNSENDSRVAIVIAIINVAIWASRQVLKLLMLTGYAASCFLSRQMEYHADRCSMEVAGSEGVESSLIRVRERSVIQQIAFANLNQIWKDRHQLPDCLPDFFDQTERRLPPGFHEHARLTLLNESSGFFATHPTANQRIKYARQLAMPGIFAIKKPARALFNNFIQAAQAVTVAHYRRELRLPVTNPMLKSTAEFFQDPSQTAV